MPYTLNRRSILVAITCFLTSSISAVGMDFPTKFFRHTKIKDMRKKIFFDVRRDFKGYTFCSMQIIFHLKYGKPLRYQLPTLYEDRYEIDLTNIYNDIRHNKIYQIVLAISIREFMKDNIRTYSVPLPKHNNFDQFYLINIVKFGKPDEHLIISSHIFSEIFFREPLHYVGPEFMDTNDENIFQLEDHWHENQRKFQQPAANIRLIF